MKTKNNLGIVMYGLCFMIVSALIISAAAVPAYPVEDDDVNIPQTDMISPERDIESPRHFMYDDFDKFVHPRDILNAEEENDGLERTFIGVTDLRADTHSIYLNVDNTVYFTVNNLGGDVGDQEYTKNIIASIEDIEELRDLYIGNPRVGQLDKAVEHLDEALIQVKQHQREESIKSVRQAVVHLNAASQGRHGIPTEQIIIELGEIVRLKVYTVIEEAAINFGSEHPDVQDAEDIYEDAVDRLDDGKYIPAMNRFRKAFGTVLGAYVCDVNIHAYSWMPDGHEEDIWSGEIEQLEAESYEVLTFNWHPTVRGIHYLRFNMTGEYEVYRSPPGTEESPFRMMSFGVVVIPMADEEEHWYGGKIIDEEVEFPSEGYDSTEIYMEKGNLIIKDGGALIFRDDVTFIIENEKEGDYGIHIEHGGRFVIDSPLRTTTIKTPDNDRDNTYFFHNYGTLHFTGANVMYTYGPDNTYLPGGIQNFGSTAVLDNTTIIEADTHSVYIGECSNVRVMGEESVIGRHDWGDTERLKGHGIFVEGAAPLIRDVTVQRHKMDGIHVRDSQPGPIPAASLHYYASGDYDWQLTDDGRTSTQPIIVAGNGNLYMVYLDEDADSIYFMRSSDQGRTWSEPIIVPGSEVEEGYLGNIDLAADGDKLAVVWEVWYEAFPDYPGTLSVNVHVQYSSDGGSTWADETYLIPLSHSPSAEVEGNNVYVVYVYRPDPPFPVLGAVRIMWTGTYWIEDGEYEFDIIEGVPKVAVAEDTVHIVIASGGYVYYARSDNNGHTWTDLEVITEYTGEMPYGYMAMDASEDRVYLVWSMDVEYYGFDIPPHPHVYGMYAVYEDDEWVWSDEILISSESTGISVYPDVTAYENGNWYVVWQNPIPASDIIPDDTNSRIRYSVLNRYGEVIVADMCLTPDTEQAILPSITIDSDGYAYVVWRDDRGDAPEIYIKQTRGFITETLIRDNWNCINIYSSTGVIISRNHIWGNRNAIQLHSSSRNIIANNNVGSYGISLSHYSNSNVITNNIVSEIEDTVGILLEHSLSNTLIDNKMENSGIFFMGEDLQYWNTHDIDTSNTVNDKPVQYWKNRTGGTIPSGAGQVILVNCTDVTVEGQHISHGCVGITLGFSSRTVIEDNNLSHNADGIILFRSHDNTITNNEVWDNWFRGIHLYHSDRNTVDKNIQMYSHCPGIYLLRSHSNYIYNNNASHNTMDGILLYQSTNNNIHNNTAYRSRFTHGITLFQSDNNNITGNTASENGCCGIFLRYSNNNNVINNNASRNLFIGDGITLEHSHYNNVTGNTANSNNYAGIFLWYSDNNNISNNTASENDLEIPSTIDHYDGAYNGIGVFILYSNNNIIRDNTLNSNRLAGIFIGSSHNHIISCNEISRNGYGVYIHTAYNSIIYNNNFLLNEIQAWDTGEWDTGENQWDSGSLEIGGNYWSDYEEKYPDAKPRDDAPWIWNTPYRYIGLVPAYREIFIPQDRYPLVNPAGNLLKFEEDLTAHEESDGWLFLSFPLIPIDSTVPNVLRSIEGSYDKVLSLQGGREEVLNNNVSSPEWRSYVPDRPDHFNNLKVLDNTHGFWIRMTEDASLTVYGYAPEVGTTTLVLEPGWNMVGYPSISEGNNNLPEEVDIIGYFDKYEEHNLAYDYNPADFVFVPGQGYWIHNPTDVNIIWTVELTNEV